MLVSRFPDGEAIPTVELIATAEAISGWNLQVITTDFGFVPARACREFVPGKDHAHLHVDGVERDHLRIPGKTRRI